MIQIVGGWSRVLIPLTLNSSYTRMMIEVVTAVKAIKCDPMCVCVIIN